MKCRIWAVDLCRHEENFSGLRTDSRKRIANHVGLVPTTKNIEALVGLFTDMPIDTRWMSIAEQVRDSLDCGFFTIDLLHDEDFVSYHLSFIEV